MDVTEKVSTDNGQPKKLVFADISNEAERTYTFADGQVTIYNPAKLNVSRSFSPLGRPLDSHRIIDAKGLSYYVPAGWLMITWLGKDGTSYNF